MEKWVPVIGYESLYEINEHGDVKSLRRNVILVQIKNHVGYLRVGLYKNGKMKNHFIHRLVLQSFQKSISSLQVNHIDGDKQNNHIKNLEWVTPKQNINHAIENGLSHDFKGEKNPSSILKEDDVKWIRENYKFRCKGLTTYDLARKFNVSRRCIAKVINYKTWTHVV